MRTLPLIAAACVWCASPLHAEDQPTVVGAVDTASVATLALQEDQGNDLIFRRSDRDEDGSVYDDTWLAVGFGAKVGPTYNGSDDYRFQPIPVIAGSFRNIDFKPRAAGMAVDVVQSNLAPNIKLNFGPVGRARFTRAKKEKDPVVAAAGKLDTAVEIGAQMGIGFKKIFSNYDRISISSDIRWDVAGAHGGMVIDPGISYRTPLSRGIIASLSLGAEYGDAKFNDYYFSVSPEQAAASGLPQFKARSGFYKAGASLGFGVDLDGDLENGGFLVGALLGYSRMIGDGKRTPYTSVRGDRDQFSAGAGIGFVF